MYSLISNYSVLLFMYVSIFHSLLQFVDYRICLRVFFTDEIRTLDPQLRLNRYPKAAALPTLAPGGRRRAGGGAGGGGRVGRRGGSAPRQGGPPGGGGPPKQLARLSNWHGFQKKKKGIKNAVISANTLMLL